MESAMWKVELDWFPRKLYNCSAQIHLQRCEAAKAPMLPYLRFNSIIGADEIQCSEGTDASWNCEHSRNNELLFLPKRDIRACSVCLVTS